MKGAKLTRTMLGKGQRWSREGSHVKGERKVREGLYAKTQAKAKKESDCLDREAQRTSDTEYD